MVGKSSRAQVAIKQQPSPPPVEMESTHSLVVHFIDPIRESSEDEKHGWRRRVQTEQAGKEKRVGMDAQLPAPCLFSWCTKKESALTTAGTLAANGAKAGRSWSNSREIRHVS